MPPWPKSSSTEANWSSIIVWTLESSNQVDILPTHRASCVIHPFPLFFPQDLHRLTDSFVHFSIDLCLYWAALRQSKEWCGNDYWWLMCVAENVGSNNMIGSGEKMSVRRMVSLIRQIGSDSDTSEMDTQRRLQRMLEETLTKNMHLQVNTWLIDLLTMNDVSLDTIDSDVCRRMWNVYRRRSSVSVK